MRNPNSRIVKDKEMIKKIVKFIIGILIIIVAIFTTYLLTGYEDLSVLEENMKTVKLNKGSHLEFTSSGEQSELSSEFVTKIENEIEYSENPVELLRNIYNWKKTNIKTKHAKGKYIGKRSIEDILNEMTSTGCHDDGIIFSSILRHYEIPSVMVDAVGISWIGKYNDGKTKSHNGHVFVEVYYDDKCFLFDSTLGKIVVGYDPENKVIPTTLWLMDSKGFYTLHKGTDPASYGIKSVRQLNDELRSFAKASEGKTFELPNYKMISIKKVKFGK